MRSTENYADFKKELRHIVSVLCGTSKESFENEKMQRLFQLKYWLNSNNDDYTSMDDAAGLYAGLRISAISATHRDKENKWRFNNLKDRALKSNETCALFERWAPLQSDFALFGSPCLFPEYSKKSRVILSVNHFTGLCIKVDRDKIKKKIHVANEYYLKDCRDDKALLRDLDPHRKALRSRAPFLYVASSLYKGLLLAMPETPASLLANLSRYSANQRGFQRYFAHCAYVQSIFSRGLELSGRQIAGWAGMEPRRLPELPAPNDLELEAVAAANIDAEHKREKNNIQHRDHGKTLNDV